MRRLQALALSACLLFGASARAVPLIYDFEGTGTLCSYVAGWCTDEREAAFTGWVLIDVLADGPNGPDGYVLPDETQAVDLEGWVYSEFYVQWDGGSFSSHPIPEGVTPTYRTVVVNTSGYDALNNSVQWNASGQRGVFASLSRQTGDGSWLDGLTFEDRGLAPPFGDYPAVNRLYFSNRILDPLAGSWVGYIGDVREFSYFALRPTEVPEPATLSLFGLALAGLGIVRRRRRMG